jgi:hypothetical protein
MGHFTNGVTGSCPAGSISNPSAGCPDGFSSLTAGGVPWQHGITVWRNNSYTPQFDATYQYTVSPMAAPGMGVDTGGSVAALYSISPTTLASSVFAVVASGSNWKLSPLSDTTKCLDAGAGTNGSPVVLNACTTAMSQTFAIAADSQTGAFILKSAATGRCVQTRGAATTMGTVIEVDDCTGTSTQKLAIQALIYPGH